MVKNWLSRWVVLSVVVAALGSVSASDLAFGAQPCSAGVADLQAVIGATVVGAPVGCVRQDAAGDLLQVTTTGLAVYQEDGTTLFASGDQHWALTDQGLQTWTANWHNGLLPPAAAPTAAETARAPEKVKPAVVHAMTLVREDDASGSAVLRDDGSAGNAVAQPADASGSSAVVQPPDASGVSALTQVSDASGSMLVAQLASDCPGLPTAVGDHVFVRSDGLSTDLVLVSHHQTCAVASLRAADND
jgi:hypothetical protein